MKKLYIACPYSDIDKELSYRVSMGIAAYFINKGFNAFAPIVHSHPIAKFYELPGGFDFWSQIDYQYIDWCDEIVVVMLDGWEESTGVQAEIEYAVMNGKTVSRIDPWSVLDRKEA